MKNILPLSLIVVITVALFILGCSKKEYIKRDLIFTQVNIIERASSNFPEHARIVAIDPIDPNNSFEVLTSAFQSARSPQSSFDGKYLLFSGKFEKSDLWQIWEMTLSSNKIVQITKHDTDCTDPVYLPDGKILFSARVNEKITKEIFALFTIDQNGNTERISYQPHADLLSAVMLDGRIVTSSQQLFPEEQDPKLLALRPDGTKSTLYYQSPQGLFSGSRVYETSDNHMVLVEIGKDRATGDLIRISTNRPMHSREVLSSAGNGQGFHSVYPVTANRMIVSFKDGASSTLGIYDFDLYDNKPGEKLYTDENWNSIEPQYFSQRPIPKILPTTIDLTLETGKMICMNSSTTDLTQDTNEIPHSIQVQGINNIIGNVEVKSDGSFYVELSADIPVRFQAFDNEGNKILDPSSWLWVRPNESRGCVGCHEDRELTPENRVPEAIMHKPVSLISQLENAE